MTRPVQVGSPLQLAFAAAVAGVRSGSVTAPSAEHMTVFAMWSDTTAQDITAVDWNTSESMTLIASTSVEHVNSDGSRYGIKAFRLSSPTSGSHTLALTTSTSTLISGAHVIFHDTVNPTTPTGNGNTNFDATPNAAPSLSITSDGSNDRAIGVCMAWDATPDLAAGSGTTQLGTSMDDGWSAGHAVMGESTAANPTLNWTLTTFATGGNVQSGFSLKGTSGGGGPASYQMTSDLYF